MKQNPNTFLKPSAADEEEIMDAAFSLFTAMLILYYENVLFI